MIHENHGEIIFANCSEHIPMIFPHYVKATRCFIQNFIFLRVVQYLHSFLAYVVHLQTVISHHITKVRLILLKPRLGLFVVSVSYRITDTRTQASWCPIVYIRKNLNTHWHNTFCIHLQSIDFALQMTNKNVVYIIMPLLLCMLNKMQTDVGTKMGDRGNGLFRHFKFKYNIWISNAWKAGYLSTGRFPKHCLTHILMHLSSSICENPEHKTVIDDNAEWMCCTACAACSIIHLYLWKNYQNNKKYFWKISFLTYLT